MTMQYNYLKLFTLFILGLCLHFSSSAQSVLVLRPVQDNTLYETTDGSLSNGAGDHLFAGKTGVGTIRRGLLKFNVSSLPSNAIIQEVSLEMNISKSAGATTETKLYLVRTAWGEGTSDASGPEGMGTSSTDGDATWIHTSYPNSTWNNAGGDRLPIESATTSISGEGKAKWKDDFMTMDVQGWLEEPEQNFGWMIVGEESIETTANRFDSRESDNPPILQITYTRGDDDDDDDGDDGNDDDDDDDNGDDGNDDDNGDDGNDDDDDDDNGDDGNDDDDDDDNGDDGNDDDDDDDNGDDGNDDDNGDDGNDDDDDDDDGDDDDDDDSGDDGNDDDDDDGDDDDDDDDGDDGNDDDDDNGDDGNDDDDDNGDDDVPQNMASIQIIHNSPDPIISGINIDINGEAVAQNLGFRSATNFFEVPANQILTIGFAPSNGFGGRQARVERPIQFEGGKRYVLMASGVLRSNQYDRSVNRNIKVNAFILMPARKVSAAGNGSVDLVAFHGTTDATDMDVVMPQINQTTVDDLSYGLFTEYVTVPALAGRVQLDVMNGRQSDMMGVFYGDLSQFTGQAVTIFSSGFMNPQRNQNGASFGLFAALADGTVIALEKGATTNETIEDRSDSKVRLKRLVKLSPNPAESWVNITLEDWAIAPLLVQLYSPTGQLMREEKVNMSSPFQQLEWNISDLPSMIYTVKITQGERVITQQLGVQ